MRSPTARRKSELRLWRVLERDNCRQFCANGSSGAPNHRVSDPETMAAAHAGAASSAIPATAELSDITRRRTVLIMAA
jgi:hypothetical protein